MSDATLIYDVYQAFLRLKIRSAGSGFFNSLLCSQEAGSLLRREIRIFKGVVNARSIDAGTIRCRRGISAIRLAERKTIIKSRAALPLRPCWAVVASGPALLSHLEIARRTLLPAGRASGLMRCLGHCDFDACFVGTSSNRGDAKCRKNQHICK